MIGVLHVGRVGAADVPAVTDNAFKQPSIPSTHVGTTPAEAEAKLINEDAAVDIAGDAHAYIELDKAEAAKTPPEV
jgi:hypothetical protein